MYLDALGCHGVPWGVVECHGVISSTVGRGLAKEHLCEIISKSVHRFSRGSCLKLFSIYSPGGHLVQHSGMV